jgi:hypothetical protein
MGKCLSIFLLLIWAGGCASGAPFDHSHALFGKVLRQFNQGGLVNYAALKAAPEDLDAYLKNLSSVSKSEFNQWHKGQQIAFLLNLYNASVLKLVCSHYPVATLAEIGGTDNHPEQMRVAKLFGRKLSLQAIRDDMLRSNYPEPRIHFALVRGTLGSPMLREEPYTPDKLDTQLADQAQRFMSNPAKNRIDLGGHVIYLSPIFQWYAEDFEKGSGSLRKYIAQFFPPPVRQELGKSKFEIQYTEYDASLNDQHPARPKESARVSGRAAQ